MTTSMAHPAPTSTVAIRLVFGLLLVAHGAVHTIGLALLWKLGEPGQLTYADGVPEPGTTAGYLVGAVWAIAGVLFVVAGVRLALGRPWAPLAVAAALVSLPPVALMVSNGPTGVAIDVVVLAVALVLWWASRQPTAED